MAKKAVKKKVKKIPYTQSRHHHHETNNLVLIVAGGFVVLVILMFMVSNTNMMLSHASTPQVTAKEEATDSENVVTIANYSYAPQTITVKVGDKVTFMNKDNVTHTVTADDGSFDTGDITTGTSQTISFTKAGTFPYHCTYHAHMTGTVVVEE